MSAPSNKSSSGLKAALAVLVLAVIAGLVWYFARPEAQVVLVRRGKAPLARPGSVTVEPEFFVLLTSEVGGRVMESALDEGKKVKEGEFLVQLDPADIDLKIQQQKNDIETLQKNIAVGSRLQLQLASAQADLDKSQHLLQLGQIASGDVENQRRAMQQIEQQVALEKVANDSQVKSLQNQLAVLELQEKRMRITAPFAGVIKDVQVHKGSLVGANAPVATLISNSRSVEAHISEEDFTGIDPSLHQKASVRFLTYGDQMYGASVVRMLPTADPTTQRYTVYLNVDLPEEKLTPGLNGEASIVVGEHDNALIIPRRSVLGNRVLVVVDGRVEARDVKLGYTSLSDVEVLQGLQAGEAVIVQDLDKFTPGQRVSTDVLAK